MPLSDHPIYLPARMTPGPFSIVPETDKALIRERFLAFLGEPDAAVRPFPHLSLDCAPLSSLPLPSPNLHSRPIDLLDPHPPLHNLS